jgi:hypothetical protein
MGLLMAELYANRVVVGRHVEAGRHVVVEQQDVVLEQLEVVAEITEANNFALL